MEVISLVGSSGTGKSYRALIIAKDRDIDYIVDDGLLIKGNKIIAGVSAKREPTKLAAVRRALFMDASHRRVVAEAVRRHNPNKILILGTSDGMVDKITQALNLPPVKERIDIEDIATEREINLARQYRFKEGKHVIPVPTFEIKKDFSGYFLNTLKIFRRKKDNTLTIAEKTVVRPTYSYLGKYTIYHKAIVQIIKFVAEKVEGVYKITRIDIANYPQGIIMNIDVVLVYGIIISQVISFLQKQIKSEVEYMTSINILRINIEVKNLIIE